MKWSTMSAARAAHGDARRGDPARRRCSTSAACGRIRPRCPTRATNWSRSARRWRASARRSPTARQNPELQHIADSAMRAMRPRLFEGKDDVMASAELASYLGDVARKTRVWLQDASTRPAAPAAEGVRTLRVEIRAESDLLGTLMFLQALERGDKLVRVDRLDISRSRARRREGRAKTLSIAATISGFAVSESMRRRRPKHADPSPRGRRRRRARADDERVEPGARRRRCACALVRARSSRSLTTAWTLVHALRVEALPDAAARRPGQSREPIKRASRRARRRTSQAAVENDLFSADRSAPSAPYRMPGETVAGGQTGRRADEAHRARNGGRDRRTQLRDGATR